MSIYKVRFCDEDGDRSWAYYDEWELDGWLKILEADGCEIFSVEKMDDEEEEEAREAAEYREEIECLRQEYWRSVL